MSEPGAASEEIPATETTTIDPTDSNALAVAIQAASERATQALAAIREQIEGYDHRFKATERALALMQPLLAQATNAFNDLNAAAAKIKEQLRDSAEPYVEVPVKALSKALANANATLEAIVTIARQYDAKFKLSESLCLVIEPHHARVRAAITDASTYATAAAESATSQLQGVHAAISDKGLSTVAASMISQLVSSQAHALNERFAIRENVTSLAEQATRNVTAIANKYDVPDKLVAASEAVKTAVEKHGIADRVKAVDSKYAITDKMSALDNHVTGGRMHSWATAAFSRGMTMASGALEYAAQFNTTSTKLNQAFVFIKPHAVTDAVKDLVSKGLVDKGIRIVAEGSILSEVIDEKKLIDQHYYAIASKATILKPHQLNVPADKFEAQFGEAWSLALDMKKVYNAMDGCHKLGIDADEMDKQWGICKKAGKLIKFGGGFYCGLIEVEGKDPIYVFNGFFMSMRSKFTAPGLSIYYYVVEFDANELSWEDFRGKVLGPTDPAEAPADSLRGLVMSDWKSLGLEAEPNVGDNGVHASASPFEGLAERLNWVGAKLEDDEFGKSMLKAGISEKWITAGCVDPQVPLDADGNKGSLFDSVEDMDSNDCLAKLSELFALAPAEEEAPAPEPAPEPEPEPEVADMEGDALAKARAAARQKAADFAASLTPEEAAIYGAKVQVAASGVRPDSDSDDEGEADFAVGGEDDAVLLGDY